MLLLVCKQGNLHILKKEHSVSQVNVYLKNFVYRHPYILRVSIFIIIINKINKNNMIQMYLKILNI
jgi:hypothetical protein